MAQRITRGVLVTNLNDIADLTELSVSKKTAKRNNANIENKHKQKETNKQN